jgi:hypothetical protein
MSISKVILTVIIGIGSLNACKTVKKVAVIKEAISKKDTAQVVIIHETPKVDSALIVQGIIEKVAKTRIDFKTFNAKIKVDYESTQGTDNYVVYLSMAKDSVIFIRIRGSFMGIPAEGMQIKINKDSVVLVSKVGKKYVQYRSIDFIQESTKIPFDFYALQDLLIGNPIFLNSNIVSYKDGNEDLLVLMVGAVFKHLITLSHNNLLITHSKLDDIDMQRNRTCDISFSNYQSLGDFQFATYRKLVVAEKSKLDINMDFKEYSLNEPLKYTFVIPKNYQLK